MAACIHLTVLEFLFRDVLKEVLGTTGHESSVKTLK
jgi:hypothetical protein